MSNFPLYKQLDSMDCGPTCLRMVAKHYERAYSVQSLREASQIGKDGVNLLGTSEAAERIGLKSLAVKIATKTLINETLCSCFCPHKRNNILIIR